MKKIYSIGLALLTTVFAVSFAATTTNVVAPEISSLQPVMVKMNTDMMGGGEMRMKGEYRHMYSKDMMGDMDGRNFIHNFIYNGGVAGTVLAVILALVAIAALAFWVWMFVHAVRHDIDDKPVWLLVIWLLSIVGAVAYYFAVKRAQECYCCDDMDGCGCCGDEDDTCCMDEDDETVCGENCGCEAGTCKMKEENGDKM